MPSPCQHRALTHEKFRQRNGSENGSGGGCSSGDSSSSGTPPPAQLATGTFPNPSTRHGHAVGFYTLLCVNLFFVASNLWTPRRTLIGGIFALITSTSLALHPFIFASTFQRNRWAFLIEHVKIIFFAIKLLEEFLDISFWRGCAALFAEVHTNRIRATFSLATLLVSVVVTSLVVHTFFLQMLGVESTGYFHRYQRLGYRIATAGRYILPENLSDAPHQTHLDGSTGYSASTKLFITEPEVLPTTLSHPAQ
ncbi:hypothetical protein BDQ12DRAFT_221121 [Crucibulum laeve]|uniref:Uncharacterized protein n=1 Tax=Crucibulum laeve TaxID=68775 RepID=A0A5C3LYV5_9AGAR|nr:hypothetical protein BDQ12DRAFT_221121 [Crucibulum laeve]